MAGVTHRRVVLLRMQPARRPVRWPAAALVVLLASNVLIGGADAASRLDPFADGAAGAEAAALRLASTTSPLAVDDHGTTCPTRRLRVEWQAPATGQYGRGAYLEPIGAPTGIEDRDANGIVVCRDSSFRYLGFEASRLATGEWTAYAVPAAGDEDPVGNGPAQGSPAAALPAGLGSVQPGSPWFARWGRDIEPLAAYDPQSTCDPSPKVAVAGFRGLVREKFTDSGDLGIGRECSAPGVSEHKEGRAWDWAVRVDNASQAAEANALISWLLATDEYGNRYAMARRLGVMYIIWDGHIWGSYRADDGWRPYAGDNPHTDHVHISFDRAGALGQTSFWDVVPLTGVGDFASVFSTQGFGLGPVPPPHELGGHAGQSPPPTSSSASSPSTSSSAAGQASSTSPPAVGSPATDPTASAGPTGPAEPGAPTPAAPGSPDQPLVTTPTTAPIDDLLGLLPVPTTVVDPTTLPLIN